MDLYAQNILDRYKAPFHKGKNADAAIVRREANHSCGDEVETRLNLKDGKAVGYGFEGVGCAISQASADLLGDRIDGLTADEMLALGKKDIVELLGIDISLRRSKCALLGLLALQNGLLLANGKEKRSWTFYHV